MHVSSSVDNMNDQYVSYHSNKDERNRQNSKRWIQHLKVDHHQGAWLLDRFSRCPWKGMLCKLSSSSPQFAYFHVPICQSYMTTKKQTRLGLAYMQDALRFSTNTTAKDFSGGGSKNKKGISKKNETSWHSLIFYRSWLNIASCKLKRTSGQNCQVTLELNEKLNRMVRVIRQGPGRQI